jgi:hypothetical protein
VFRVGLTVELIIFKAVEVTTVTINAVIVREELLNSIIDGIDCTTVRLITNFKMVTV